MKKIYLVAGNKGGCGKTLLQTANTLFEIRKTNKEKRVCAIDLDFHSNLFDTFNFFTIENHDRNKDYIKREVHVDETNKILTIIKPNNMRDIPKSPEELWEFIEMIIEKEDFEVYVIDSWMDLPLLNLGKPLPPTISNLLINKSLKLYLYFIWSWDDPTRSGALKSIQDTYDWFVSLPNTRASNFINVFNVFELRNPKKLFGGLRRECIGRYEKNKRFRKRISVSMKTLVKWMKFEDKNGNRLLDLNVDVGPNIEASAIPVLWEEYFKKILKLIKKNGVPANILLIPEYFDLPFYTASRNISKSPNIRQIQESIKGFYRYVRNFNLAIK